MMIEINLDYRGELRCQAVHQPSSEMLITDAPTDNHGRGESFSPTDLLAAALGSCMMTIMGIKAQHNGWDIQGTKARVEKHMSAQLPRRVARVVVDVTFPASVSSDALPALRRAALGCPVIRSLHPDTTIEHHFSLA